MAYLSASAASDSLQLYTCPVCMEIFQNPTRISCGNAHVFCEDCVKGFQPVDNQFLCPQCRSQFHPGQSIPANDIVIIMKSSVASCTICGTQMNVPDLREHMESCEQPDSVKFQFKPIKETSQHVPSMVPNRSTFKCPYCPQANLECKGLVEHCNARHSRDPSAVVCPICASMPWGDPTQCSINFIQHLNTRHKFEYETYVDYAQDDDAMLRAALEASLQEK